MLAVLPMNTSLFLIWEATVTWQRYIDQVLKKIIPGYISTALFYLEQKKKEKDFARSKKSRLQGSLCRLYWLLFIFGVHPIATNLMQAMGTGGTIAQVCKSTDKALL